MYNSGLVFELIKEQFIILWKSRLFKGGTVGFHKNRDDFIWVDSAGISEQCTLYT